jgi:hypothetical protein
MIARNNFVRSGVWLQMANVKRKMIAFCPWLKAHFSEFIVIVVIVEGLFLDQIQFDRIQTYDF